MSDVLPTVRSRYSDEEFASLYTSGRWKASSFFDLIGAQAGAAGDRTFVFDGTTSLTYGEFHERALRLAVGIASTGVGRGDRVAVQLPNWTEFPLVAAALSRIGAIIVPIMPIYRDDEVGYVLDHSGAVAAITADTFRGFEHRAMFQILATGRDRLRRVIVARPEGDLAGATALESLYTEGDLADLGASLGPDSSPDDGFLIVYTSGTTSRPKGCYHTFNTLRASAEAIAASLRYTERDVQFGPSPITHSTGLVTSVVLPLLAGASSYLMEAWDPQEALARIERHGCTATVSATPFLQMLMTAYDPAKHDPSSMRVWVCAGSPISAAVVERAGAVLPHCRTLSLYGRSENFLTTMCTLDDAPERALTSDGSALAGAQVKVVGPDGLEVPRGEEGDIAYRGPSHMLEYFRDEKQTAALFTPEGFSRSGDLGRMDADGFVRVTGRTKDIIIRGGMNISAREIEDHLLAHPAIADVAVVGMPDERLGEKACAFLVLEPGAEPLTLADITDYLRAHRVAVQKVPERLEVVPALPMTATGKVQKHVLRAEISRRIGA
ncbi:cyclohexanecarboxylate-CoA ligase [Parafrankia irregularis]|uniref:Cyclohexanecarboxylate-CoA ligase n=1 Tax=Parafrankia irregularis TaxID=795642 RepID=A0A0S4QNC4_9ACTN|nr:MULTISPECIES: AMP-binding protein [Parafrankia]MBE3200258.1 AMP-binding protein [Parafrankia sp. CH37]CUU56542.1 cyclohexanecarboxylate-CoA ligase [Parafrankia irregularis]